MTIQDVELRQAERARLLGLFSQVNGATKRDTAAYQDVEFLLNEVKRLKSMVQESDQDVKVHTSSAPTDFLGNQLFVGDSIVFMQVNYRTLMVGRIFSLGPKKVAIVYKDSQSGREERTAQFYAQVVKKQ